MKIIVTHTSPDWDGIGSIWLLKKFLPGWSEARVEFVPAGSKKAGSKMDEKSTDPIEKIGDADVIHVDTGMGPLDHHQTNDTHTSAAGRVWEYIKITQNSKLKTQNSDEEKLKNHVEAIDRIVNIIVETDHFHEVFWDNPAADYHDFSLLALLDGVKMVKPDQDAYYVDFGIESLEAILHHFENKIWAEKEIRETGKPFKTKWGKGIAFETINDTVLKLAQKMGYVIVVRKDPRKGYVRIKARPYAQDQKSNIKDQKEKEVDLTLVYEQLKKMDPDATWFLHVSKKMLLNGTPKNPKMVPSRLQLNDIIRVIESI